MASPKRNIQHVAVVGLVLASLFGGLAVGHIRFERPHPMVERTRHAITGSIFDVECTLRINVIHLRDQADVSFPSTQPNRSRGNLLDSVSGSVAGFGEFAVLGVL